MLRFFFCLIFIIPVFFIPSLVGNQNADASIEIEEDTYDAFTDMKISALNNCEDETIPVYFRDEYVETHSAAFLHQAVDAATGCEDATIHIVNLQFENMNEDDLALADNRAEETTEFVKAYETDLDMKRSAREVELDTRAMNGRAVIVEFEFGGSDETSSAVR